MIRPGLLLGMKQIFSCVPYRFPPTRPFSGLLYYFLEPPSQGLRQAELLQSLFSIHQEVLVPDSAFHGHDYGEVGLKYEGDGGAIHEVDVLYFPALSR
jgi:hypothetical protein